MKINLIWAQDENGGIGKQGRLPWYLPDDLKNFKQLTVNHPVIMGRVTWEGLPIKPLPRRRNIVISKNLINDVECYSDIDSCMTKLRSETIEGIFIIGGARIYESFYPIAADLHISTVSLTEPGIDTFIPISTDMISTDFLLKEKIMLSSEVTYSHWQRKNS
ncbi:MAG: dihydrofolate reductase [Candidatus Marinimicrobia bacterium]|nr:dihydrofolate reductase [Candidatus Neomarinimicrobiota bacterium]